MLFLYSYFSKIFHLSATFLILNMIFFLSYKESKTNHSHIAKRSYVYCLHSESWRKKKEEDTKVIKLPNLLPFLGIAIKEPRLPPITLCGLRSGGFLKDPVYWWRKECILWEVGGLPFFTIGSAIQSIQSPRLRITWEGEKKNKRIEQTKGYLLSEMFLFNLIFVVLFFTKHSNLNDFYKKNNLIVKKFLKLT